MQAVKDMVKIDLTACEAEVDGVSTLRRCKDLDQAIRNFLLDEKLLADFSKEKWVPMVVVGNHSKVIFASLMSLRTEFHNDKKCMLRLSFQINRKS